MRNFKTRDVFQAARIMKKHKLNDVSFRAYQTTDGAKNGDEGALIEIGINAMVEVLSNKNTEKAGYELLSLVFEKESKEIADMDADVLLDQLLNTNVISFFKQASRLM